jgi:NitT/TauT family transport system substrate-binding protein
LRAPALALVTSLAFGVAACGGSDDASGGGATTQAAAGEQAKAKKKAVFVTDFGFNGRHSYYYVALEKGYYAAEGIDLKIERGGGSADAIKQVAAGRAQLGFADAATLVVSRGNDDVPVKMVAAIYQKPPQAIFALGASGIKTPKDLEGRTLADAAGSAVPAMFPAYAKAAGIDAKKVKWTVADSAALPTLLSTKRVAGIGQFTVGEPLLTKAVEGKELTRLSYADAGLDYYGNGIIASEDVIQKDPDLVKAFVRATLKGMETAFANPDEAGQIFNKYHSEIDPDIAAAETKLVADLAEAPGGGSLGSIDPARVQSTIDVVSQAFDLKGDVAADQVYASGLAE